MSTTPERQHFNLRIDKSGVAALRQLAQEQGTKPHTLAREILLDGIYSRQASVPKQNPPAA